MKIKVTRTMIKVYEVNKDYYPEGSTIEDILEIDKKGLEEEFYFEDVDKDSIELEVIEE